MHRIFFVNSINTWASEKRILTKRNRFCCRKIIGLSDNTIAFIQTRLLKTTLNMMNSESASAAEIIHNEPRL